MLHRTLNTWHFVGMGINILLRTGPPHRCRPHEDTASYVSAIYNERHPSLAILWGASEGPQGLVLLR